MSFTDHSWLCPAGVTSVTVECWGSGGGGRIGQGTGLPGCGGGGGAYARKNSITVVPGNTYNARVGNGGLANSGGDSSLFNSVSDVEARGGSGGLFEAPGTGGQASASTGDVKTSGGNGGPFPGEIASPGTGGGGSGGRGGNGANGSTPTGGAAIPTGGGGGNGGNPGLPGQPGTGPGGGGGGGDGQSTNPAIPGVGADGAVVIWLDTGAYPPSGAPLASFGSPPVFPTNPKTRKGATFM